MFQFTVRRWCAVALRIRESWRCTVGAPSTGDVLGIGPWNTRIASSAALSAAEVSLGRERWDISSRVATLISNQNFHETTYNVRLGWISLNASFAGVINITSLSSPVTSPCEPLPFC